MALTKKKKKTLLVALLGLLAAIVIRPISGAYVNEAGTDMDPSRIVRKGLFTVGLSDDNSWTGTVGLFGSTISWVNASGGKSIWARK